jgi:hypothetical protein
MADPQTHVVVPETDRKYLSTGEYIDIKRELNAGEWWDLIHALADRQAFAKPIAYLVGWSLVNVDKSGPLPYSLQMSETARRDTIRSLDKYIVRELMATLDKHEQEQDAKKKAATGPDAAPGS